MPSGSAAHIRSPPSGIRVITSKYNLKYIQFESGFEAYDIGGTITGTPDPWEINNIYSSLPVALSSKLQKTLDDLKLCKGNGGLSGGIKTPSSISCIVANDPVLGNGAPPPPLSWPPSPPSAPVITVYVNTTSPNTQYSSAHPLRCQAVSAWLLTFIVATVFVAGVFSFEATNDNEQLTFRSRWD